MDPKATSTSFVSTPGLNLSLQSGGCQGLSSINKVFAVVVAVVII